MIVLQLTNHVFQLLGSLLQVLLVDLEFFGNLWPALLSQDILELDIKLLFLLNEDVLLTDFFGLCDQTFLQRLNLLDQLICLRVCALKLPPTVHIKRLLQLVSKELSLLLLLKILLFKKEYLTAQVRNASCLVLRDNKLSLHVSNVLLSADDLSDLLLIVNLALVQGRLLYLDFFIEDLEFLITLDKLGTKYIALVDYHLVVLLLLLLFLLSFSDDELETGDVALLCLDHVIAGSDLFLDLLDVSI